MRRRATPRVASATVHSITSVPISLHEDQSVRVRNYVLSMGVRTLCFILAGLFSMTLNWTAAAWVCVVGAVVLPYPAVILANATSNRKSHFVEAPTPVREIGTAEDQTRSPGPYEDW
ncbi:MAG TPA: DUF3099 domain-containing protein [Dermatophilaceae bacterium]|nr:DUF3099 domain-containing protein [Dermatophilaceae bacterium]